ncbi:hypothetical protein O9992_05110 [Vibrio lentus]|nr:hypothetical protein [Vibrio lentus]
MEELGKDYLWVQAFENKGETIPGCFSLTHTVNLQTAFYQTRLNVKKSCQKNTSSEQQVGSNLLVIVIMLKRNERRFTHCG